ncbi:MAG TPA: riboflavin synthase [Gemmatimonadaceae bacterium]|nr:riboflavin synthase [Gemmatimonadaceae bacterium]
MFTGLVEAIGTIESVSDADAGREFRVRSPWPDLQDGESIAINGACLTVRSSRADSFVVAAVVTTLDRTTMGSWSTGTRVNLERAMKVGDRFGGHMVQGHVDGVGTVRSVARQESALLLDIDVPPEVARLLVPHGSLTVDGVSLTVNRVPAPGVVQVSIIEWTERHTTLGALVAGDRVHLEADVIGKYVQALLAPYQAP